MKFSDIEYFDSPSYRVTVLWDYMFDMLGRYEKEYNLIYDPEFQRGYVWTEQQQIHYIEYILKGGTSGKEIYFNHPSWSDFTEEGRMILVDGKQRIDAVKKFLDSKIKVFSFYYNEFSGKLPTMGRCFFNFNVNNLKDPNDVIKWYISMNSGGSVHTKEDIERAKKCLR